MRKNALVAPILKWAGGKRQLVADIERLLPRKYGCYFEPFVGGGALWFHIQPSKAVINDLNRELINVYEVVKTDIEALICELKKFENSAEYYYKVRDRDRQRESYARLPAVKRASRIIYLNKTCYNGLFRVNKSGEFNAPFGYYKKPCIVNEPVLRAVNCYLNNSSISITSQDFELVIEKAKRNDFVYFDPPYDPVSDTANFTGYNSGGFCRDEQKRLKNVCDKLNDRGVKFLLSNSATDFIQELYSQYDITIVHAKRNINSIAEKRGDIEEVLVRNYE